MISKKIILLLLFIVINNFNSQITPPAPYPNGFMNTLMVTDTKEPSVARFQEYSFVPVDLYAGKAQISIPFFEIQLDDLNIPISLEYNTQGIQVNSLASRVGTGWVLKAGGNIGRSVKEVNDFHFVARNFAGGLGSGGMPLDCANTLGHPLRVGWKYRKSNVCVSTIPVGYEAGPNNIDISPDIFTASAPGLLTQFYYPDSELNVGVLTEKIETTLPVEIEPSDTKFSTKMKEIQITYPSDSNFPSFFQDIPNNKRKLRDYFDFDIVRNGYKYSFNDYDISYLNSPNSFYDSPPWGGINHQELNWEIGAWHLNKIENVNTNKKVEFIYESVPYYITSQLLYKFFIDRPEYGDWFIKPPTYNNVNETNVHVNPKRIKTIISDEVIIQFQYNHTRKDLIGDYALTNVQVFNKNNKLVKEYKLFYDYMNDTVSDGFGKRLYLNYVEEFGLDNAKVNRYSLSYFEGNLPGSNATNQNDWYGYYKKNINGADRPILFLNTNMRHFSILPIALSGVENYPLRGNFSIDPNENDMKVGMLQKLTYPTGGYIKLEYEANRFRLNNQEVLGGGLRIARQELYDINNLRKLKYIYKEQDGKTSGYVNNVPSYGYSLAMQDNFNNYSYNEKSTFIGSTFLTLLRSLISVDKTQSNFVGYASVKEEEEGKGYTNYQYSSPKEFPSILPVMELGSEQVLSPFLKNNTAFPFLDIPITFDVRTGKIKSKKSYNSDNKLVYEEIYQYDYKTFNNLALKRRRYVPIVGSNYRGFSISGGLLSHRNLLTKKINIDYFSGNHSIENKEDYEYDDVLPLIKEINLVSGQDVLSKKFYYPKDILSNSIQVNEMQQLINQNRNATIIKNETFKNNIKLNEKFVKYASNQDTQNMLHPVASYESMTNIDITSDKDKILNIDRYDAKGHILQTTDKSKIPTATIWGYNQTLPIANVVGATYMQIASKASNIIQKSNTDVDIASEKMLINELDNFRKNLPLNSLVTTYTHDPHVGVTSITSPTGIRKLYRYDATNRLEEITDSDGNKLEQYKYNYALRYFNTKKNQVFKRNNCGVGYVGSSYNYTVGSNQYSSTISQADADQQAQNQINLTGQSRANIEGNCIPTCPFSLPPGSGLYVHSSSSYSTSNLVNFNVVISNYSISAGYWNTARTLGFISGECKPFSNKEFTFNEPPGGFFGTTPANRTWQIRIDTLGNVSVRLLSGSVGNNSGNPITFQFQFQK